MIEHLPLVLAQAVPVDPTGGLYSLLLEKGILGAALAFLIFAWWKRDSDLQKANAERLEDVKMFSDIFKNHTVALQASNIANDERNRALEVAARAAEKNAIIIEQLHKNVELLISKLR